LETNMIVESRKWETLRAVQDSDGPLLAVAIAATLVEYQRYAEQQATRDDLKSTKANWRTVVRLEQLRGLG
jgi:hypothetical protein